MPASQFMGWMEYFSIYPFTQDAEDLRTAKLCAVIANMSGKATERHVEAKDFLPDYLSTSNSADDGRDYFQEFAADVKAAGKLKGKHAARKIGNPHRL